MTIERLNEIRGALQWRHKTYTAVNPGGPSADHELTFIAELIGALERARYESHCWKSEAAALYESEIASNKRMTSTYIKGIEKDIERGLYDYDSSD